MSSPVSARYVGLTPDQNDVFHLGIVVQVSDMVPEGEILRFSERLTGGAEEMLVGPLTFFAMTHDGNWPLESRYSRGMIELERARRKAKHG